MRIATIAHAGDGNLHPLIIAAPDDERPGETRKGPSSEILATAIGFGGTVTGEHGVGLLKRDGMRRS